MNVRIAMPVCKIYLYIYIYIYRVGDATHPLGICDESYGFTGTLCSNCMDEYSKKGTRCSICPASMSLNIFIMFLVMIGAIIIVIIVVKSSIDSATEYKPRHSVYFKIMLNHLTIIGLLANFDLRWPEEVSLHKQYACR